MGWRSKFVFLLIVYFAGFATAIYCLAPAPENRARRPLQVAGVSSAFRSEEWARSVNSGIHKCVDLGKDAALEAAKLIQEKMKETQAKKR
jgi:hypothetical protein